MATARSSPSSSATVVHQLADLFRTNGHRVLHGDSKVCFTSDSLTLLNNYFQSAKLEITIPVSNGHRLRTTSIPPLPVLPPAQHLRINTKLRDDLIFLHDFLHRIQTVKLIHNSATLQGNVLLYPFQHVVCLELKKIPPHMVLGLSVLRTQLETLICSQSVTKIEDLISDCGGDSDQPQVWPRLKSLFLGHNFIERLDDSLKDLVALEILDLSHNRLKDCSKILEIIPHIKHLNLSSNQLRTLPVWSDDKGPCPLVTLKIRQNAIEDITGIETMKAIDDLDLSDNFITRVPDQIRHLHAIKRLHLVRNPFTYDSNYRQTVISNLPFVFAQETRYLMIDDQPLSPKEKQKIPMRRSRPTNLGSHLPLFSSTPSPQNTTTSESTTEPESIVTNSTGTIVSRRKPKSKRESRLRSLDVDEIPVEHATSGSDDDLAAYRYHLGRPFELRQETDPNNRSSQFSVLQSVYPAAILEADESTMKPSTPIASSIPRKLANDLSQSPKRRKSPRTRRTDHSTKIFLEVVDVSNTMSDETPVPDSPPSEKNDFDQENLPTPLPVLQATAVPLHEDHTTGDSIRTIFFVTDQTFTEGHHRSLTIELDPMYLIEKDHNDEKYLEKLKYSTINLIADNESNQKMVKLTFEKRRGEVERRVYLFDTIQDQKAFMEEFQRYLESSIPVELQPISPVFLECIKCGKTFPPLSTMNGHSQSPPSVCLNCQNNASLAPTTELPSAIPIHNTPDISFDKAELDHRLHFHIATEHFTHDDEQIKLHFKCFVVRSTTTKHFIAQTILTDYGIYIFQYEASSEDIELEYVLVGKDLLTNVLMLDIGYQLQTFTIELQSAAFAFLLADSKKTQQIVNKILEVLSPVVQSGDGALQKISRISSDEYRQRLFQIIETECHINEPNDEMIEYYSIMIRMDQAGNSQMIAVLLLRNWILMIEDAYATINARHVRLPAPHASNANGDQQLKCDLMHLVNVINYANHPKLFVFDFVDESETRQFRWKLEGLTNESKSDFLTKVRDTYKNLMAISMPERSEMV